MAEPFISINFKDLKEYMSSSDFSSLQIQNEDQVFPERILIEQSDIVGDSQIYYDERESKDDITPSYREVDEDEYGVKQI